MADALGKPDFWEKWIHKFSNLSSHGFPDWSSQNEIVFVVLDDLWIVQPDGTGKTQLTTDGVNYEEPSWSPEGTEVAVTSPYNTTITSPNPGIVIVDRNTGLVTTEVTGPAGYDNHYESPTWSPDGDSIAFAGYLNDDTSPVQAIWKAPAAAGTEGSVADVYQGTAASFEPAWGVAP